MSVQTPVILLVVIDLYACVIIDMVIVQQHSAGQITSVHNNNYQGPLLLPSHNINPTMDK